VPRRVQEGPELWQPELEVGDTLGGGGADGMSDDATKDVTQEGADETLNEPTHGRPGHVDPTAAHAAAAALEFEKLGYRVECHAQRVGLAAVRVVVTGDVPDDILRRVEERLAERVPIGTAVEIVREKGDEET
jgi:hypothetical protein